MPKRKREDTEQDVDGIKNQAIRIKASRLKARFDQGVIQLTQALKLARGFDRQKMTRRLTQAGSDKVKLDRLKAEVEVLNKLQEGKLARKYLLKQCVRTKRIAEAEGFNALFGGNEKVLASFKKGSPMGVMEGNVLGRLMKSGPVSDVVPGVMKGIREVVGADRVPLGGIVNVDSVKIAGEIGLEEEFAGFSDDATSKTTDTLLAVNNLSMNETEDDLDVYDDRLAASSDSEADLDDLPVPGQTNHGLDDMELTDEELPDSDEVSLSSSNSDLDQPPQKRPARPPPTTTSFLPTLMNGGYYSGSDSDNADPDEPFDPSYDPDKAFAEMTKPPRKNRRGQQERRAIAEKKFGTKAKHLIKEKGAEGVHSARQGLIDGGSGNRDQGWDAKRGATAARGERKSKEARPLNRYERRHGVAKNKSRGARVGGSGMRSTGSNSLTVTGSRPVSTFEKKADKPAAVKEKLHPSWEAARKRKIESATVGASSFTGKKITFD